MESLSDSRIELFQEKILSWYDEHQRDLPWRKSRNPYHILVSEIMLQQTQVNRVIPKFEAWLKAFPDVKALANAPVSEVLALWSGLGYNRRALNLKKTATVITEKYKGNFPQTEKELLELPGIGQYTSRAVLCFAFDKQVAVVDTNVKKVILTQFLISHPERSEGSRLLKLGDSSSATQNDNISDKEILTIAEHILPHGKAYEWNQALMDYASAVLKKEKIPIPKQSTFKGSHRFYRGQILKLLLKEQSVALSDVGKLIKDDYMSTDEPWLKSLIQELVTEGFVVVDNKTVKLAS